MSTATTEISPRYLALLELFRLRPIRDDATLDAAIAVVNSLVDQGELSPDEDDYLEVLSDQIILYERVRRETHPYPPLSDVDMFRHLIESRDVTQAEVARGSGVSESTLSAILRGRRKLGLGNIVKLAKYFGTNPGVFFDDWNANKGKT